MSTDRKTLRRFRMVALLAVLALCLAPLTALASHPDGPIRPDNTLPPVVKRDASVSTGYTVTFRYRNAAATRVQIKGEWYFERPSALPNLASQPGNPVQTPAILPTDWQPGDVPIASPNSTNPNWPVVDMTKNAQGIWTYTTPLPAGVFTYGFFVNCADPAQAGCTQQYDPSNPPWSVKVGVVTSPVLTSQVYVPADPRVAGMDFSWQMPTTGTPGALTHVTYPSAGHVTPANENYLVVYTPPNYDPNRAKPYPTLWLNHGGGENEMGWSTQGALQNIMDNLINSGEIQPMLVVNPNAMGYPGSVDNAAYRADLITNAIPYIEAHYNVSHAAADRAYSGLSMGGLLTNQFMLYNPETFGYYGMMSAGFPPANDVLTPAQAAALKGKGIYVGAGWQDVIFADGFTVGGVQRHTGPQREVGVLVAAGLPVVPDFVNGGHNWYVWRILLKDFVTRVAFWPAVAR